ncbi:MAG: spoIIIJ-associated protein [Parcubacteria group bacterium LiPW_39]|nr:MAG: spoIIIJ-associated protein [Parcubacteria group bacterium LiPW_39]
MKEKIKQIIEELLKVMDFEGRAELDDTEADFVRVNIVSPEAGFLIGRSGENLKALQQISRALVNRTLGQPLRFIVDINDYQKSRLALLKEMARHLAQEVAEQKVARWLAPMNAYERRAIHLELADFSGIKTESEGEGEERRVVIKPTDNKQLTINNKQ